MKKILKKILVPTHKYQLGDYVKIGDLPETFEIAALYYNLKLEPVYILKDNRNKLHEESEEFIAKANGSI